MFFGLITYKAASVKKDGSEAWDTQFIYLYIYIYETWHFLFWIFRCHVGFRSTSVNMTSCHKRPILYLLTCHIVWKKWVEMTHKVGIGEPISRSRPSGFSGSTFHGCLDPNDYSWSQGWPQIPGDIREWDWPNPTVFFSAHDWYGYGDHSRTKGWTC